MWLFYDDRTWYKNSILTPRVYLWPILLMFGSLAANASLTGLDLSVCNWQRIKDKNA